MRQTPEIQQDPWTACFLSGLIIRYLEAQNPDSSSRIDYASLVQDIQGFERIPDPRSFLLDPNNWVPHSILGRLIYQGQQITESKDFPYQAGLHAFDPSNTQAPNLWLAIAQTLHEPTAILRCASAWANATTNYLKLYTFTDGPDAIRFGVISISHAFDSPFLGGILLTQGLIEGIVRLSAQGGDVNCREVFSQIPLARLVAEFGEHYSVEQRPKSFRVLLTATGKTVLQARPISLLQEPVTLLSEVPEEGNQILHTKTTNSFVLAPPSLSSLQETDPPTIAWQITRGGTLSHGPLSWQVKEGSIFNAPYSRYEVTWNSQDSSARPPTPHKREDLEKSSIAHFLINHLSSLQATQRRTLGVVLQNQKLSQENALLKKELDTHHAVGGIIGKSQAIRDLIEMIKVVAPSDATVLITGETGSGKELVARLIHELSPRGKERFVSVNCGALTETLLESELFGHERGAFTGALSQRKGKFEFADQGSIFLDEIGDISAATQVKLLRVLQEKEFQRVGGNADLKTNVRVIAATNRDLEALMKEGDFRSDLYYRLNVIQVHVPPLRDRMEDVPDLLNHFIDHFAQPSNKQARRLTNEALDQCLAYPWPGNVRELEHAMERAVTLAPPDTREIGPELLPPAIRKSPEILKGANFDDLFSRIDWTLIRNGLNDSGSFTALMNKLEWAIVQRTITEHDGNKTQAAQTLGRTYRWLRKLETSMHSSTEPAEKP